MLRSSSRLKNIFHFGSKIDLEQGTENTKLRATQSRNINALSVAVYKIKDLPSKIKSRQI